MNSSVQPQAPLPIDRILPQQSAIQSRSTPTEAVELPLTPSRDFGQQYLRDLETLDRIEFQNECFFDAMGAIAAGRTE